MTRTPTEESSKPAGEFSLFDLLSDLLEARSTLVVVPVITLSVALLVSIFVPAGYTATATFIPESGRSPRLEAPLAGLASQFGLGLSTAGAGASPEFYADLLTSDVILRGVLQAPIPSDQAGDDVGGQTVLRALARSLPLNATGLARGVHTLRKRVTTTVDSRTGVVTLKVEARTPRLAATIASLLVERLNQFNLGVRQTQGRERRKFVEARLVEVERRLQQAEADLRDFYARNRVWRSSPDLEYRQGALQRQVEIQQDLYLTLRRQLESARLDEINDTPLITLIDPPEPPVRSTTPNRLLVGIVAAVLGFVLAIGLILGRRYWQIQVTTQDPRFLRLRASLSRAVAGLRAVVGVPTHSDTRHQGK